MKVRCSLYLDGNIATVLPIMSVYDPLACGG